MRTARRCPRRRRPSRWSGCARPGGCSASPNCATGWPTITAELPFQEWDADPAALPAPARRLISHTSVRYRRDDLSGALPLGVLEPLALPYRSYRQAFTDSLVADLYGGHVDASMLRAAGYLREGGAWWLPSGRVYYSPGDDDGPAAELDYARRHFFLPHRFTDPFGNPTAISYDRYDLLVRQTRDPLGNLVTAGERDAADQVTADGTGLPGAGAAPGQRPEPEPVRGGVRRARPGLRDRHDGQAGGAARRQPGRLRA